VRKAENLQKKHAAANSFEAVAEEWIAKQRNVWDPGHADQVESSLKRNLYPELGNRPISEIDAPALLGALRKIEARGAHEIRQRVQQRAGAVFRYGIATGRCARDPSFELRRAFTPPARRNHAALTEKDLPDFLERLHAYDGEPVTKLAMRLLALTFVRTGELRGAEWHEFDRERAVWRIPAERMKMRDPHIVPLSRQALAVLEELAPLTGHGRFLFPHRTNPERSLSENTILYALYRMGYHTRATGHGFRATASTILNEIGFAPDVIERQLAHMERNKVRAAYNRAQYLPERTKMMQAWADLLDGFTEGSRTKVVAGKFGKAA
jgi:integrase